MVTLWESNTAMQQLENHSFVVEFSLFSHENINHHPSKGFLCSNCRVARRYLTQLTYHMLMSCFVASHRCIYTLTVALIPSVVGVVDVVTPCSWSFEWDSMDLSTLRWLLRGCKNCRTHGNKTGFDQFFMGIAWESHGNKMRRHNHIPLMLEDIKHPNPMYIPISRASSMVFCGIGSTPREGLSLKSHVSEHPQTRKKHWIIHLWSPKKCNRP